MQAIGMIETKGLLAAIEAADTMLKAADVTFLEKQKVGGGRITVLVTGDVGAVKAAVDAGVMAVKQIQEDCLLACHVIPRPHEETMELFEATKSIEILTQVENPVVVETPEPVKVSKPVETSESVKSSEPVETPEQVKTSEPVETSAPTEIPTKLETPIKAEQPKSGARAKSSEKSEKAEPKSSKKSKDKEE